MKNNEINLSRIVPYGDTLDDGKVQLSFTLPLPDCDKSVKAALILAQKMGLSEPAVAYHSSLDNDFSFFIIYGTLTHSVNYNDIHITSVSTEKMDMEQVNQFIKENIRRKIVIVGASTGTDAHTVGIDAILNMKGFAGHYGLERYEMMEVHNLGSQVTNEEFVKYAIKHKADCLLVSQTVTQKDIHIANLSELSDMVEAADIRNKVVLICGGSRISNDLAKELGYDAGFGSGKFADDVAAFIVMDMKRRRLG